MTQNFCRLLAAAILLCAFSSVGAQAQAKPEEKKAAAAERSKTMKELDFTWKRAKKWTLDYIDAMPEDAISYKPTPDIRSFGEQMLHLAFWNCGLAEAAGSKPSPFGKDEIEKKAEYKSKAALKKAVEQSYDFVIAAVSELDEKKLSEEVTFFNSKVTRLMALTIALDHQAHHRGQTTLYLRLKGITPPPEP